MLPSTAPYLWENYMGDGSDPSAADSDAAFTTRYVQTINIPLTTHPYSMHPINIPLSINLHQFTPHRLFLHVCTQTINSPYQLSIHTLLTHLIPVNPPYDPP